MTAPLKADQQAADRLLKTAVRWAVEIIRDGDRADITTHDGRLVRRICTYDRPRVVAMLTAAGESAALLLDEQPAKKAAARKAAS